MYIGSGVVISSGAVLGTSPAAPTGNLVLSYVMGNSASYNGQGVDLTAHNFINAPSANVNLIFDLGADYANGAIGNLGTYTTNLNNGNITGSDFVNNGPISYLSFTGTTNEQYVDSNYVNGYIIPSGGSYTYFAVVRVNNFGAPTNPGTMTGGIVGGNNTIFGFLPNGAGPSYYPILVAGNQGIGALGAYDLDTQFQPNTWYALAVTYNAISQTMKLYVNGVNTQTFNSVAPFSGNEPIYWGTWEGDNWLNGDLAVMQAYDYALNPTQISNITTTYGNDYGIVNSRQNNNFEIQTYSQLYPTPGAYRFIVPAGVTSISTVAVGAGGGGTWAGYSPPGGDSYIYSRWSQAGSNFFATNTGTNINQLTFDASFFPADLILGNVSPGWLVTSSELNNTYPNRASIQGGDVYAVVESIDTSNTANVVITINMNINSVTGGATSFYFQGQGLVGASGALEINDSQYYTNNLGTPGPRALPLIGDGGGMGGVVNSVTSWPIGGAGAGGYGTSQHIVAFDPNQTYIYDGSGDRDTGVANVLLALSNNNLTVAGTANNTSGNEGIATGTYSFSSSQVMFSLTVDVPTTPLYQGVGFGNYNANLANYVGGDTNSVGFYNNGYFYFDNGVPSEGYPSFFGANDIVDIAIDDINHLTWVRVNGGDWLGDPAANPSTATNGVPYTLTGPLYLMVTAGDINDLGQLSINTSNTYPIPSGYTFIAGTAYAGSTGGTGTLRLVMTATEGLGDGSTFGGSGGGGGGIYSCIGSGGGGVGLYGVGNPGTAGGWLDGSTFNGNTPYSEWRAQAVGGRGGSRTHNTGTNGGIASAWAGGAGGWPGGGGGSGPGLWDGGNGGALAYKNTISVTPSQELQVIVGQGGWGGGTTNCTYYGGGVGGAGAVRIVWPGDTRTFPNTSVGLDPTGPSSITVGATDFLFNTSSGSGGASINDNGGYVDSVTFTGTDTIGNQYVYLQGSSNNTLEQDIFALFRQAGMYNENSLDFYNDPNTTTFNAYIFHVTWADSSTGIVRMSWDPYGKLFLSVIDTASNDWQTANPAATSPTTPTLAGTFGFPATFTPYAPLIESNGNYWC